MRWALIIILIHFTVFKKSVFDQILTPNTGVSTFGRGSHEPKYDVEFHWEDSPFLPQEGWWSYEFCYHSRIRQLHMEDEKVVQEYILGYHDPEATFAYNQSLYDISTLKDPRSNDASERYAKIM